MIIYRISDFFEIEKQHLCCIHELQFYRLSINFGYPKTLLILTDSMENDFDLHLYMYAMAMNVSKVYFTIFI